MSSGFPRFVEAAQAHQFSSTQYTVASFPAAHSIQILWQMHISNSAWGHWANAEVYW